MSAPRSLVLTPGAVGANGIAGASRLIVRALAAPDAAPGRVGEITDEYDNERRSKCRFGKNARSKCRFGISIEARSSGRELH